MIKHDETSNPNSCLNRAELDEPVFVLRANDLMAPGIVRSWAVRYWGHKQAVGIAPADLDRVVAKYNSAMELAEQMEAWRTRKLATACITSGAGPG